MLAAQGSQDRRVQTGASRTGRTFEGLIWRNKLPRVATASR